MIKQNISLPFIRALGGILKLGSHRFFFITGYLTQDPKIFHLFAIYPLKYLVGVNGPSPTRALAPLSIYVPSKVTTNIHSNSKSIFCEKHKQLTTHSILLFLLLFKKTMEESNLLHSLFLNGNYHLIIDKIVSFLDLESLQSLTLVDSLTYSYLKKHLQQKTAFLRYSWLSRSRPQSSTSEIIRNDSLSYPVVVCDDLDIILFGEKLLIIHINIFQFDRKFVWPIYYYMYIWHLHTLQTSTIHTTYT